ncbi:helix-turn-helix transcriptional regulator [Streptomyces sp. NBC_00838]|uniref:helix-turn-helix domain-containing protein n=1 Tax=Streptomyces sp. NBC_00838 TaxID=2903680 RepID=UPI0038687DB0|nr:helix-turn-helix transcriptional regulator [Streptomyces sp. NBC_00838]
MTSQNFKHPAAALGELRARLEAGLVAMGLSKTLLARRAGLGRTTVSEAFSRTADVPSAHTMGALARALGLDPGPLLALRAAAVGGAAAVGEDETPVGRPIAACDPHDLEVHPAAAPAPAENGSSPAPAGRQRATSVLPGYVRRPHDEQLTELAAATASEAGSRMAVLVGSSSTGKTRACWEAVQPLAEAGWRLWHPFDPTRAEAALANLARVAPRTVVWLNEAQHYLGAGRGLGERIGAALHGLLTDPARGPVLVLGTLWPAYAEAYAKVPREGEEDPHPQVRELLAGRLIHLPDRFDASAEAAAEALAAAGDRQLAHALHRTSDGRLTQFLAGAPELLHRYAMASPAARAVLDAAMDARRLGSGLYQPLPFLEAAAEGYLTDDHYETLAADWLEQALADLSRPVHGNLAPLRRVRPRPAHRVPAGPAPVYRLADYLEQHGRGQRRLVCPPASFWHSASAHLTAADERVALGEAARLRWRLRTAAELFRAPAATGHPDALAGLAHIHYTLGSDRQAEELYGLAADAGSVAALTSLYWIRKRAGDEDAARLIDQRAADAGEIKAILRVASQNMSAEERAAQDEEFAAEQTAAAAAVGYATVVDHLTALTEESWTDTGWARLRRQAYDNAYEDPHDYLSSLWSRTGNDEVRERLYEAAAAAGHPEALYQLAERKYASGERAAALELAFRAAETGHVRAAQLLAWDLEEAGDTAGAEYWHRRMADHGDDEHLMALARLRQQAHDTAGALAVYQEAAATAGVDLIHRLNWAQDTAWQDLCPYGLDPDGTPSTPWQSPLPS